MRGQSSLTNPGHPSRATGCAALRSLEAHMPEVRRDTMPRFAMGSLVPPGHVWAARGPRRPFVALVHLLLASHLRPNIVAPAASAKAEPAATATLMLRERMLRIITPPRPQATAAV
jgi:hypothetical protein